MTTGYYSLIQFCPDPARAEAVNLGVVLFCPAANYLDVKLTPRYDRVRKLFGKSGWDAAQLRVLGSSIESRLRAARGQFTGADDLDRFAAIQGNSVRLTPARRVLVDKPSVELGRLYDRLVGQPPPRKRSDVSEVLKSEFSAPVYEPLIRRDVPVVLPELRRAVTIPYGYKNGRFNLIKPARFGGSGPSNLVDRIGGLLFEGPQLYRNPDPVWGDLQLVVVGQFSREEEGMVDDYRRLLADNHTRLYLAEDASQLFEEIKRTAKPLPDGPLIDHPPVAV